MGALIAGLIKKKIAGEVVGLIASKTQWGATAAAGSALWFALPRAMDGDPEAITVVGTTVVGWATALWGRLKARLL